MLSSVWSFVVLAGAALSHPLSSETIARSLPAARWYHDDGHHIHGLFRRQDPSTLPAVGSPQWFKEFPAAYSTPAQVPNAWTQALNTAVSAGLIPNTSVAANGPRYPSGDPSSKSGNICSATFGCYASDDVVNGPSGVLTLSFDDGPYAASAKLYDFLQQQNQKATHFMIGSSIIGQPNLFTVAFQRNGDDIACHTWSHPYMTTLTNAQVVAELGWTLQLIHDSTGGRVPKFWRPPYGDVDNRVRAIAKNVFGLTTVIWNRDTEDWTLTSSGGTTPAKIHANMQKWLSGAKSPGLVILEHELSTGSVQSFIDAYPLMKSNGWNVLSVPDALQSAWYQNAQNDNATVQSMAVAGVAPSSTLVAAPPSGSAVASNSAAPPSGSALSQTKSGGGALHISSPSLAVLLACALSSLFFAL